MAVVTTGAETEITKAIRNGSDPITACNFTDEPVIDPLQALQKRPEITCNTIKETASITSEGIQGRQSERGTLDREVSTLSSPSFDDLLGIDDPRADRCPACGSRAVMPTMLAVGEWECWDCRREFVTGVVG